MIRRSSRAKTIEGGIVVTPTPDVTSPAEGGKVVPGRIMGTQPDVNDQRDQQ
jgi:hypothetical protein